MGVGGVGGTNLIIFEYRKESIGDVYLPIFPVISPPKILSSRGFEEGLNIVDIYR